MKLSKKNLDVKDITEKLNNITLDSLKESSKLFFEKLKDDKKFQKHGGICLGIIVALLVGTHFVDLYQQQTIKVVSEKQAKYEEIQKYLEKHNKDAMDYKESVAQINSKILEESEVDKANTIITKLAEANNIQINNNKKNPKPENVGNNIFSQKTSLELSGNYSNILNFIQALENESFFASCESLTIGTSKGAANNPANISVKTDYKVFFVKNKNDNSEDKKAEKKGDKKAEQKKQS